MDFIREYILEFLYRLPAILIAISFHEWAHAYAAYRLGDPTARNLGRMTVNPLAHIDPIGFVMMLIVRFGWAKPVPINTRNFKKPRRDELIVSLAGVTVNLGLAFVFTGIWIGLMFLGVNAPIASTILEYIVFINLALCVFNLLPVPPLDGYRVVQCLFVKTIGPRPFMVIERYSFVFLIGLLLLNSRLGFLSSIVMWLLSGMSGFYMWLFGLFM